MKRLIRFLAVIALALSPVWGFPSHVAALGTLSPAHYPVWPSFLSTGCTALQGPGGSTSVSCGGGSFLLSQINSGYECNNIDISISSFQQGSFLVVGTVNSGSQSNTVHIDGPGDYYMQFPGFLTNNLVTIQMTAGSAGSAMTIAGITSSACVVPSSTPTVNPSFTPTDTAVPVTGTPTPIPTHTPLPSGHSTFTATATSAPGTNTATPTATPTALPSERNCGDSDFPLLNCDLVLGVFSHTTGQSVNPDHWQVRVSGGNPHAGCGLEGSTPPPYWSLFNQQSSMIVACWQHVTPGLTGNLYIEYTTGDNSGEWYFINSGATPIPTDGSYAGTSTRYPIVSTGCLTNTYNSGGPYCVVNVGTVTNGSTIDFGAGAQAGLGVWSNDVLYINKMWVGTTQTPTPAPTHTVTPTITGTIPPTPIPSSTPIPIPGAMSTGIATSTECPGSCAVTALTAIPGLATITTVDTSPFSQLQHLSLARNSCTAFGYVQIPYPVIHGTPALGTSNPISVTWTLPVTHDWDNTNPYSNTAIEPCAMNEIPTFVWDFTYWLSVFSFSVVFIIWLIGFVGRLSGDETING